jgi:hypothetical protein
MATFDLAQYTYVWLPDDDLQLAPAAVSALFRVADHYKCVRSLCSRIFVQPCACLTERCVGAMTEVCLTLSVTSVCVCVCVWGGGVWI